MKYFFDHGDIYHKKQTSPWYICVPNPLMHKSFYSIKENKSRFLSLASFREIKGKRISPGNRRHKPCCCQSLSLLMLLLRSGEVISNLLLMLRPCFAWLLSCSPNSDGCWHQVAPIGCWLTDGYHDNLWTETTWLAASSCIRQRVNFTSSTVLISLPVWINPCSTCDELQEIIIIISIAVLFICFRHHAKG